MANGGFAGGVAQGFTSSATAIGQIQALKAQRASAAAKLDLDRKKFTLDYWDKVGPQWEEVPFITDPNIKSSTLQALALDAEQTVGAKPSKPFLALFKMEPAQFAETMKVLKEQGLTLGDAALIGQNPRMAAQAFTALAKRLRTAEGARAAAGTGDTGALDPTAGTPAAPGMAQAADFARLRIAQIRQELQTMIDRKASDRAVAAKQTQLSDAIKGLEAMTTGFAQAEAERGATPVTGVPEGIAREQQIVPGVTRLRDIEQRARPGAGVPAASGTAPAAPASGAARLETPQERTVRERRAKPIVSEFGERIAREAAQAGLRTIGEYEDALTSGKFKPRTPEEAVRVEEVVKKSEATATKLYEDYVKAADLSTETTSALTHMQQMLKGSGPTGAIVGPIRNAVFQFGALFGVTAGALEKIETVKSLSVFLASQTLKDFTGNDSYLEYLKAIERNPGLTKQQGTNDILIRIALHNEQMKPLRAKLAAQWRSNYDTLTAKHPETGRNFEAAWHAYRNAVPPVIAPPVLKALIEQGRTSDR